MRRLSLVAFLLGLALLLAHGPSHVAEATRDGGSADGGSADAAVRQTPAPTPDGRPAKPSDAGPPTAEELSIVRQRRLLELMQVLRILELLKVLPQMELDLL